MPSNSQDPIDQLRSDIDEVQEEYERKRQELSQLEAKLERLRNAYDVMQDYLGEGSLADDSLSIGDAAERVLRDASTPMDVSKIADLMLRKGFPYEGSRKKLKRSLAASLSRDEEFERVERGIYRLTDVDDNDEESNEAGDLNTKS